MKVLRNYKDVIQFGFACGLFSALYKGTRCLMKRLQLELSKDQEVFIAALVSSLSLFLMKSKDMNIIKIFIYPRALEAIYNLLVEKKYLTPIKYGETILAILAIVFYTYNYIFEPYNVGMSTVRTLDLYSDITNGERQMFESMRRIIKRMIMNTYPYHRLQM